MIESAIEPTFESRIPRTRPTEGARLSLDDLAARTHAELSTLYAKGACPEVMSDLDGDLTGRMVLVRSLSHPQAKRAIAAVARSAAFPWGGKSFQATSPQRGVGINRVRLFGQHRLFPFATRFEASALDGAPALVLDYSDRENPAFIRAIHDEVRLVAPDLYLGPACIKRRGSDRNPRIVLWFALDAQWVRARN